MRRSDVTSHSLILQIRQYEVTLGDNPSVLHGVSLSLGWRYDPHESRSSLLEDNTSKTEEVTGAWKIRHSRSMGSLLLSDRERRDRLLWHCGDDVSIRDIHEALCSTERIRLEREESVNEYIAGELLAREREEEVDQSEENYGERCNDS